MPAVTISATKRATVLAAAAFLAAVPTIAHANAPGGGDEQSRPPGSGNTHGDSDNGNHTINAKVDGIYYERSKNGKGRTAGPVTPVKYYPPPKCWFMPKLSPEEFKKIWEPRLELVKDTPWGKEQIDRWVNGKPIKDFNIDNADKGHWWVPQLNSDPNAKGDVDKCWDDSSFWADTKEKPKEPEAIDTKKLSALAYAQLRVPDTDISLSPGADAPQTVNLATWAWLDKATFKPVSVTATVQEIGLSATTTATPTALKIEPGTEDADLHPASGECAIGKDGGIGTPYTKGRSGDTPPCGLTYRRSTNGSGPFHFKATITWKISWKGSDGTGGDLPDGTYGTTTDLTVQEAQAVNR